MKMKVLAIGEIIFDIFDGEAEVGGAPLNFCAHCAALGAESAIISAVGNDSLAHEALNHLNRFNVSTAFVQSNGLPTGQCLVTVKNGIPSYNVITPSSYDNIQITDGIIKQIRDYSADVFAFGTLIQRNPMSRNAVNRVLESCEFTDIFCDVNLRKNCYDKESCLLCLKNATVLKISSEEEPFLAQFSLYEKGKNEKETVLNICKAFDNIRLVLFTKGEYGSLIYDKKGNRFYDIACKEAQVVSTVGAGDSYSAAFLCEFFKSGDVKKAGDAGAQLSAFVVAHREAVPGAKGEE